MPSALVIQHVAPEPPVAIAGALTTAGVTVDLRRVDLNEPLPGHLDGYGGLVVMGGPASARSDERFPTRRAELALLTEALEQGLPVLGVCLGAQLLALAAGGEVLPGSGLQVGWGPVRLAPAAEHDPLLHDLPDQLPVLHWHGETYRPPPGAVPLASDDRYEHQATRYGDRAWGFQFHLEVDPPGVRRLAGAFRRDAAAAGGPGDLAAATSRSLPMLRPHRDRVLARFAALVGST